MVVQISLPQDKETLDKIDNDILKDELFYKVWYPNASQKEKRVVHIKKVMNFVKAEEAKKNDIKNFDVEDPFQWWQLGIVPQGVKGKITQGQPDYGVLLTKTIPMALMQEPNEYIPTAMERAFGVFKDDTWISFFTFITNSDVMEWEHRIIKFRVPELRKQAFGTTHERISTYAETTSGHVVFSGIAIKLPYDWTGGSSTIEQVQAELLIQFKHAARAKLDFHEKLVIECVLNNEDAYMKYLMNHQGRRVQCNVREFLEDRDFRITAIVNKRKDRSIMELINILHQKIAIFNPTYDSTFENDGGWALFVPYKICELMLQNPEMYKAHHVSHKGKTYFYNQENDPMPLYFSVGGVKVYPVKKYKKNAFAEHQQLLESYRRDTIFNYFEDCTKIYVHDVKQNKRVPIELKDVVDEFDEYANSFGTKKWNNLSSFPKLVDKIIRRAAMIHYAGMPISSDIMVEKYKELMTTPKLEKQLGLFFTGFSLGNVTPANFLKGTYTGIAVLDVAISKGKDILKKLAEKGILVDGMYPCFVREKISRTLSAMFCKANSINMYSGSTWNELIKEKQYKGYYADMDQHYGVKVMSKDHFMVIEDIYYDEGHVFGCSPGSKKYKDDDATTPSNGGFSPFFVDKDSLDDIKNRFFHLAGKWPRFWGNLVSAEQTYGEDGEKHWFEPTYLKKYKDKYDLYGSKHEYYMNREFDGMIRKSPYACQGWQQSPDNSIGAKQGDYLEDQQYGYLNSVFKSKAVCNP